jgi:hypothetical protein
MRRCVVLLTFLLSFVAPLAIPAASASEPGSVQAQPSDSSCKRRRAKKSSSESKPKKKDKDGKKPYGFEL